MKRMCSVLLLTALLGIKFGAINSQAIALYSSDLVGRNSPMTDHVANSQPYTPPPVGMPDRVEGGGTR